MIGLSLIICMYVAIWLTALFCVNCPNDSLAVSGLLCSSVRLFVLRYFLFRLTLPTGLFDSYGSLRINVFIHPVGSLQANAVIDCLGSLCTMLDLAFWFTYMYCGFMLIGSLPNVGFSYCYGSGVH